jgi:hypothetical protein
MRPDSVTDRNTELILNNVRYTDNNQITNQLFVQGDSHVLDTKKYRIY